MSEFGQPPHASRARPRICLTNERLSHCAISRPSASMRPSSHSTMSVALACWQYETANSISPREFPRGRPPRPIRPPTAALLARRRTACREASSGQLPRRGTSASRDWRQFETRHNKTPARQTYSKSRSTKGSSKTVGICRRTAKSRRWLWIGGRRVGHAYDGARERTRRVFAALRGRPNLKRRRKPAKHRFTKRIQRRAIGIGRHLDFAKRHGNPAKGA